MAERENKATVKDQAMSDAFRQGFDEGIRQAATATMVYEFTATFEGTDLRRVQFTDLDQAMTEARNMLANGHGVKIVITAVAVPNQQAQEQQAVGAPAEQTQEEEDIDDAEVVEDTPSEERAD